MGMLLVLVYYIYATLGEQVFGGLIRKSTQALNGSDYAHGDYYALNFNDFFSGMVTLFCLMVVNNWFVIADGFWRVTGTYFTCVFFVSFFIVANLVVLNMLIALILDSAEGLREEIEKLGRRESDSTIIDFLMQERDILHRMLLADEAL